MHSCSSNISHICVFSGSLSSFHAQQVDEGRDHLLSHTFPSLHSGTAVMQPFSSKRSPPLRKSSNTHHDGKDQKEDTHTNLWRTPVPCVGSWGTHSVGAPQTYIVKCSQGLKVIGDGEMCVNCLNTKPHPFLLPLSSVRVKKVVCNICDHSDSQYSVVIIEVEWVPWRAWSTSVIIYILPLLPKYMYSYTQYHSSTCPTSPSPNSETQKLSRRRRRVTSLFNYTTTSWPTSSEWDSCH